MTFYQFFKLWLEDNERANPEFADQLTDSMRAVWYPTLRKLRGITHLEGVARPEILVTFTTLWENLGSTYGLRVSDPAVCRPADHPPLPQWVLAASASRWWEWRGCNWKNCLCASGPRHRLSSAKAAGGRYTADQDVRHCKLMHRIVLPLSALRRDWKEGGHREICKHRPSSRRDA